MELILSIIIAAVFLVLMVIMFILGYKEALKTKVEDPLAVTDGEMFGEGWDKDTFVEFEQIIDILGREPNEDEIRIFLGLVEEGYHGETLLQKFLEELKKHQHH
ncbi:hypothetical protein [Persephonella sp.]|uniref:hypothetical protein n=1 Tax=Persephonella sp. TaxID=2060922 RepID=UPI00262AE00F|nr:hypothetical protein [Persephonella sp.]